jgi:nucleotide-binding universal stress UspA family protein
MAKLDAQAGLEAQCRLGTALAPIRQCLARTARSWDAGMVFAIAQTTARETHGSILVMGALARSGLKRPLFGNTAEGVLDELISMARFSCNVPVTID